MQTKPATFSVLPKKKEGKTLITPTQYTAFLPNAVRELLYFKPHIRLRFEAEQRRPWGRTFTIFAPLIVDPGSQNHKMYAYPFRKIRGYGLYISVIPIVALLVHLLLKHKATAVAID